MGTFRTISVKNCVGVSIVAVTLVGCAGPAPAPIPVVEETSPVETANLPKVSDLPAGYQSVGELAGRGIFYTATEQPSIRIDDGGHYQGYDGPGVWAKDQKGLSTQGVLYGVEGGIIISVGYLTRQSDLVNGKSFHGLTLRELNFPAAHSLTVDFIEGETEDTNQYLWLWHFLSDENPSNPMLPMGKLPSRSSLPTDFEVFACDHIPETRFCPGMGRHFIAMPPTLSRQPSSEDDDNVIYGEAAGKLIFIEYVLRQEDLANGVSWPAMPLGGIPIPPIDNVHVLHFGEEPTEGRYTVHMYFIPEEIYLAWETEPEQL